MINDVDFNLNGKSKDCVYATEIIGEDDSTLHYVWLVSQYQFKIGRH